MSEKYLQWYEIPEKRWRNDPESGYRSFRDSQRQKLYNAESCARGKMQILKLNPSFPSIEEIQKFVNKLISSTWFIKRFGDNVVCKVIHAKPNQQNAYAKFLHISLPCWAWNKIVVLHELIHIITKGYEGAHGRFFARALLELTEHILGHEARVILKKEYKRYNVKHTPKKQLTDEDRKARRERFIKNVLKKEKINV